MKIVDIRAAKENGVGSEQVTLSIIVPVYNEQSMLPLFHYEVSKVLASLSNEIAEIVYVNDGSQDDSWHIMRHLPVLHTHVECLNLSRNFGKEAALTAGLEHASGQAIIIMDADLQDPPSLIPEMLNAWRQGFDVVNMKRGKRHGESWFKIFCANAYYRLLDMLSDVPIERNVGDFRLLSRRVVEHIKCLPERNRYMKGIMSWPGFRQTAIVFERPGRAAGETKWSFIQLVRLGLAGITAFSVRPLKLASWLGAIVSSTAFIYGLWVVFKTLIFGESVAGYPSIVLIQLFLGGVQLLTIGILGEYVGRIFTETKGRPIYLLMDVQSTERQLLKIEQNV